MNIEPRIYDSFAMYDESWHYAPTITEYYVYAEKWMQIGQSPSGTIERLLNEMMFSINAVKFANAARAHEEKITLGILQENPR